MLTGNATTISPRGKSDKLKLGDLKAGDAVTTSGQDMGDGRALIAREVVLVTVRSVGRFATAAAAKAAGKENTLEVTGMDPATPATLRSGKRCFVTIRYTNVGPNPVRIWARPHTNGRTTPGAWFHSSPLYEIGSGSVERWFWFDKPTSVTEVEVRMVDSETKEVLVTKLVPVKLNWAEPPLEKEQADLIVAPNANATVEGKASITLPTFIEPMTLQMVFAKSEFTDVEIGDQITGLSYRVDSRATTFPRTDITFNQYNIQMSQSNFAPGSLSPEFADNIGPDVVLVRSGPLTIPADSFHGKGRETPNDFGFEFVFSKPYTYNGGDLLITIRSTGNGVENRDFDGERSDKSQALFAADFTDTTSLYSSLAPVVRFTTAAPRPPNPQATR